MASTALVALTNNLAAKLNMGDGSGLVETLKATAFKGQVSDAQMMALCIVANAYNLNPWTKEIYAFPDKNNGIVPVVGVDGWSRIINAHPQFDGMDFEQDAESCTCIIYRKDRSHPVRVTEYMAECRRPNVGPWASHPRRMLRHKAMIQCARIAFGYAGIYDQDEAERIAEVKTVDPATGEITIAPTFDLDAAIKEVNAAETADDLAAVWTKQVALCQAAKDKNGYSSLKSAVVKRGEALKNPGAVQDVEPVDAEQLEHEDASR
jgi:phage recombination protein Bet